MSDESSNCGNDHVVAVNLTRELERPNDTILYYDMIYYTMLYNNIL